MVWSAFLAKNTSWSLSGRSNDTSMFTMHVGDEYCVHSPPPSPVPDRRLKFKLSGGALRAIDHYKTRKREHQFQIA